MQSQAAKRTVRYNGCELALACYCSDETAPGWCQPFTPGECALLSTLEIPGLCDLNACYGSVSAESLILDKLYFTIVNRTLMPSDVVKISRGGGSLLRASILALCLEPSLTMIHESPLCLP